MLRRAIEISSWTAAAILAAGTAWAQSPDEAVFEVASVKVSPPGNSGLTSISPYGTTRFTASNVTLELLIELAFGVSDSQILSAPGWLSSQRYDLSVVAKGDTRLTYERLQAPLRALLAERFQLATHRGSKDTQGYALVAAKSGTKLEAAKSPASQPNILPKGLKAPGIPMAVLAGLLSRVTGRPVVDKTGLSGLYKIDLDYAPADGSDSSLPSVFTALQERLGLILEPEKVPVETLIIDRVERIPVEN
jgi:uncharacterized protein (TIGR03435 family)